MSANKNHDIKKVGKINVKNTPYNTRVNDTNITFYDMDDKTAVLKFEITKDNKPLLVSMENAYIYIYLRTEHGETEDVQEIDYSDGENGIVYSTIDNNFLKNANGKKVKGQLYITLHQWNTVGNDYSDTAVLSEFTFKVKDALINNISAIKKIDTIRMFDKLGDYVNERIDEMEEKFGAVDDFKNEVEDTANTSIKKIKDTKNETLEKIEKVSNENIEVMNETYNRNKDEINLIVSNYKDDVKNYNDEIEVQMETKYNDYMDKINNKELITKEDTDNWQKYNFTEEDGKVISVPIDTDINELKAGLYEGSGLVNDPLDDAGYYEILVTQSYKDRKVIYATQSYSNRVFVKTFHTNGEEREWKELTSETETTGWKDLTLKNNVKEHSNAKPQYKIDYISDNTYVYLRGAVKNITSRNTIIANIPLPENLDTTHSFVQNTSVKDSKTQIARWYVDTNGDIVIERVSYNEEDMNKDDWYPISTDFQI